MVKEKNKNKKLEELSVANSNSEKLLELCDIRSLFNFDDSEELEKGLETTYNLYESIYKDLEELKYDSKESKEDRIWAGILMQDIYHVKKEIQNMNELIFAREIKSSFDMSLEEILMS